jgi:pimeloyl-ACP methyl ester carboxylesterase
VPAESIFPPSPLVVERMRFDGIGCYVAGDGPPLLLVHSVNAAASAAELRPVFEHFRETHTVFAIDLPGFGISNHGDIDYTPRLMTDAIHALTAQIRRRFGAAPIDAVAVSLGCEFLARAAVEAPDHFRRLALVSPTGLDGLRSWRQPPGTTREKPAVRAVLRWRWLGRVLFRLLTRPGVIRYFLQRTFGRKDIDEALWARAVQTSHKPGAEHAPLKFLTGGLFSADIHDVYEKLQQPVWLSHGTRGDFTDFRAFDRLPRLAHWERTVFLTGAMPYFEVPRIFCDRLSEFLVRHDMPSVVHQYGTPVAAGA